MQLTVRALWVLAFSSLCAIAHAAGGSLKVTLAPSAATSAGAQWRVDNGGWKNSGATVNGLSAGTHQVEFKAISGWLAPATTSASIVTGSTTTLTATYVQPAALQITLTPSSGQWRIDGGVWRASGATVTGLTPASHTIEYAAVSGYAGPATETVTLVAGQTTTLARSYTQLAQVAVTLSPATAQWRIDGGAWLASGATAANLAPGSHVIDYAALSGYSAPVSETVTLVAGQSLVFSRSYVQLAQLSVSLTPASAQWRIDGGAWQASGATMANLAPGNHTVEYAPLSGYTSPASESVTLSSGQSLSLTRAYVQLAQITIVLSPASAQWRVDGGAWLASGATTANLAPGSHAIEYAALSGYVAPAAESVTLVSGQSLSLTRAYVQLAQVAVTLTPATAQWRIDGGAWLASGATVANLAPGSHAIEYAALSGYIAPAAESLTLVSGQSLSLTRAYVQLAQVAVTLTPAAAQWRIDGGAWLASGATAANLASGSHMIDYAALSGYIAPPSESITLAQGQSLPLTRSYVQLGQLTVTLSVSNAQWRVDGGAWQANGATVANLAPGDHLVEYTQWTEQVNPPAETVTLAAGQSLAFSRTYTQKANIHITLVPNTGQWRVPGGAWNASDASVWVAPGTYTLEFSPLDFYDPPAFAPVTLVSGSSLSGPVEYQSTKPTLRVQLVPNTGQWRVDGGEWQPSGTVMRFLEVGSHTVDYLDIGGDYNPLPSETISLALRQQGAIWKEYPTKPASVSINLTPSTATWRILPFGTSYASGATATVLYPGTYTIEYLPVANYATPASEPITLTPNQAVVLTRSYTPTTGSITVALNNSSGQFNVDGGPPQPGGTVISGLSPGTHRIGYTSVFDYNSPPTEDVTVVAGQTLSLSRNYYLIPELKITLTGIDGEWRVDGGGWRYTGTTFRGIAVGNHTIEYANVFGYAAPPSEVITIAPGDRLSVTRAYTPLTQIAGSVYPQGAQWRINGGAWLAGDAVQLVSPGSYTIDYAPLAGYVAPPSETITVAQGQTFWLGRSYLELPKLSLLLNPSTAQWRIDGGAWRDSGTTATGLSAGSHTIDYSTLSGYSAPPSETITLVNGQVQTLSRFYSSLAQATYNLYPPQAEWRIDGGAWQLNGATVQNLAAGDHLVEFKPVTGYTTPAAETISLYGGQQFSMTRSYMAVPQISVTLTPSTAQWRVDGGPWQTSGATVYNLTVDYHTIEYSAVEDYVKPPMETQLLNPYQVMTLTRSYTPAARVKISLTPAQAQWSVDNGPWQPSGATVTGLWPGYHRIDYKDVPSYITPNYEMVDLPGGQLTTLTRSYNAVAQLSITTYPSSTQWRVNGGEWLLNGMTFTTSQGGNYTVEYKMPGSYQPIPTETVALTAGSLVTLTRYSPSVTSANAGRLIIHVAPGDMMTNAFTQYAIDLSTYEYAGWYFAEQSIPLPAGYHSILFASGSIGVAEPQPFQFQIQPGQTTEITVQYRYKHYIGFFLNQNLIGTMPAAEVQRRITQYAAHLRTIFARESLRNIEFVYPEYQIIPCSASPFPNTGVLPRLGFDLWVYADLTDQPAVGSYGGSVGIETTQSTYGAGGADNLKWDKIHDPSALADGSADLQQYWRQINGIVRQLENLFGAGRGGYDSLAGMSDASGVAPTLATTGATNTTPPDSFWAARPELWTDPLTADIYGNPRAGSPTSLAALINGVHFAPVTSAILNGIYHRDQDQPSTLPNLSSVVVRVINAQTQAPISGATVRVWNRSNPLPPYGTYEETVTAGSPAGTFTFAWTGAPNPLNAAQNAKIVKAAAPGYAAAAGWVTIYDAQKAKVVNGQSVFEITLQLTPQ